MKKFLPVFCFVFMSLVFLTGCPRPQDPHPALRDPGPASTEAAPAAETPEEKAVRERVEQLGGTCRKNREGRIIGLVIENNELSLDDMKLIAKASELESIRMTGPSVNDEYVDALLESTKLKSVDIENSNITDASLEKLKALPDIETLALRRNLGFTDNAIKLFAEFPKLKTLKILYNDFSSASLFGLGKLSTVRVLDLRGLQVGDDTLMFVSKLENLEELRIRSSSVTSLGMSMLKKCKKLRILELQDSQISPDSVESFKEMDALRYLRIFRADEFGADGVSELAALTELETLELRAMSCSNEALLKLKTLTNLKTVEFSELNGIDSATVIDVLKSFPKLESIRIFAVPVDDSVASYLATVSNLKSVALPATSITDKGLDALTALQNLTTLDIHGNKERITLEGGRALAKFKNIRRLILPETLDNKELKSEILKNSPRCVITIKTYSQET